MLVPQTLAIFKFSGLPFELIFDIPIFSFFPSLPYWAIEEVERFACSFGAFSSA
jgi:hypothetical protein